MPAKSAHKKKRGASSHNWKDVQDKTKKEKKVKLALAVLAFLAILLLVSWGVRFTQNLFSPSDHLPSSRKHLWNQEFNINLVVRASKVSLLSYNPQEERVIIINIPDETFLEVPKGFGKWQLRAVYELGQSQKEGFGNKLLADTLAAFLAIPIDGYLDLTSVEGQRSAFELIEDLRKNLFSGLGLLSGIRTNLTPWELLKLKMSLSGVRFDKIKQIDLEKLDILDKDNLLDSTPVYTADPVKLDSVVLDLADPQIVAEHKSIAVLNATDRPQLALKWARLITNLGGNVIITGNAKDRLQKTIVLGEKSQTLERLQQIFTISDKISPSDESWVSERAQITILLGEDFAQL